MDDSTAAVAALLGALQGATEFLPVSSDGHLAAFALLCGASPISLRYVVALHVGTLVATIALFWEDLIRLARSALAGIGRPRDFLRAPEGHLLVVIAVACVPTAAIGLALEDVAAEANRHATAVGLGFLVSAGAALFTRRARPTGERLSLRDAFLLGAVQGLAVLPGVSRSGSTIACALAMGLSPPQAFRISFLLAIPAVAGAMLLELGSAEALAETTPAAWLGAAVACVVGYASLRLLRRLLTLGHFWQFAWYLAPLGLFMVLRDILDGTGP